MSTLEKTAASYARISEKVERDKVADQHRQNEAHAMARGYRIVARYEDDGISALGHKTRQGFNDMLAAAERGEFQVIVATEEERLARNLQEKLALHEACAETGVVWDTARDGFVDPDTDSGEFMSTIRAAMGRIESKRKARRQLAANVERIQDGLPVPGKTRYGYMRGNIEIQPDEADRVRELFAGFLKGQSIRSMSTRMGWRAERVRSTLANPSYAGWVIRHGERYEAHDKDSCKVKTKHDCVTVGRIVDRDTYEKVQALLQAPGRRTTPGSTHRHLMSGIALCGVCDGPLTFRNNYLCVADLSHPCIKKCVLEDLVRNAVVTSLMFEQLNVLPDASRVHEIDRRQIAIEASRIELLSGVEQGGVKMSEIAPSLQRLQTEDEALGAERARIVAGSVSLAIVSDLRSRMWNRQTHRASIDEAAEVKAELAERFDALPLEQQRDLVRGVVTVIVHNGRGAGRVEVVCREGLDASDAHLSEESGS